MAFTKHAPAIGQVLSKRRKVVCDMIENVLIDFERSLEEEEWVVLGPSSRTNAHTYLKEKLLVPLTAQEPDHYNDDAKLGAAINDVVFRANAVRAWGKGAAALAALCGDEQSVGGLLERDTLELSLGGMAKQEHVLDGVGALLQLGRLKRLRLKESQLGAAEARRLSVELASSCHQLAELE